MKLKSKIGAELHHFKFVIFASFRENEKGAFDSTLLLTGTFLKF
jgi:hypothetical protein